MAPILTVSRAAQVEGDYITFVLRLSQAPTDAVTVDYTLVDGTADVGNDIFQYGSSDPLSGTATFLPNEKETTLTFFVNNFNDALDELDESFALRLTNPVGANFGAGLHSIEATGWALDDDGPGSNRAMAVSAPVVVEGNTNTAVFTISLSQAFSTATTFNFVTADGSATAGTDYVARSGGVTFAAGQTEATVAVTLLNDGVIEAGETFHLNVAAAAGVAAASGTAEILNDDGILPVVSVDGATGIEGNYLTFSLKLSEAVADAVQVAYAVVDRTADVGSDVFSYGSPDKLNGTVTFNPGQTEKTVTFFANDFSDVLDELDESFGVRLINPVGASFGPGRHSIEAIGWALDNDGLGNNRALAVSAPVVVEGNTNTAVFTLSLSQAFSTATTFNFATADGSALSGTDYVGRSGAVTFAAGQTEATVAVTLLNDAASEAGEKFYLNVAGASGVGGASGTAEILNDDGARPVISAEGATGEEGNYLTFTLKLSEAATDAVAVDYAMIDGTADVGNDIISYGSPDDLTGTVAFVAGETEKTVTFFVNDFSDTLDEFDESFFLRLANPVNATFGAGQDTIRAVGWALDNDGPFINRTVAVSDVTVQEGPTAHAIFELSLSRPATSAVTLTYQTVADTAGAADFVAKAGTVTFAAGQTTAHVAIALRTDAAAEQNETFHLKILPPFGSQLAANAIVPVGTATILDSALRGTVGADTLVGTAFAERIEGLGGDDTIFGGGGNDALIGGAGNDQLNGQTGNDLMVGGTGNDVYSVDSAADRVVEAAGAAGGNDSVISTSARVTLAANVERLFLAGAAGIGGTGNGLANAMTGNAGANLLSGLAGNDMLNGNAGNDSLFGGDGNDRLDGGLGADVMRGGLGNDIYLVNAASDQVIEAGSGVDTVYSTVGFTLGTNVERLSLIGSAVAAGRGNGDANVILGNAAGNALSGFAGDDNLRGNGGNDRLFGGLGNDTLNGGLGNDTMTGGAGADLYVVQTGRDRVVGFQNNADTLLIDDALLGSGPRTPAHALDFAHITAAGAVFSFVGGNTLVVDGVTSLAQLADDIAFF